VLRIPENVAGWLLVIIPTQVLLPLSLFANFATRQNEALQAVASGGSRGGGGGGEDGGGGGGGGGGFSGSGKVVDPRWFAKLLLGEDQVGEYNIGMPSCRQRTLLGCGVYDKMEEEKKRDVQQILFARPCPRATKDANCLSERAARERPASRMPRDVRGARGVRGHGGGEGIPPFPCLASALLALRGHERGPGRRGGRQPRRIGSIVARGRALLQHGARLRADAGLRGAALHGPPHERGGAQALRCRGVPPPRDGQRL
jgi:hypothetical protein